jgi:hypothetical protein
LLLLAEVLDGAPVLAAPLAAGEIEAAAVAVDPAGIAAVAVLAVEGVAEEPPCAALAG